MTPPAPKSGNLQDRLAGLRSISGLRAAVLLDGHGKVLTALVKGKVDSEAVRKVGETVQQMFSVLRLQAGPVERLRLAFAEGDLVLLPVGRGFAVLQLDVGTPWADVVRQAQPVLDAVQPAMPS